MLELKEFIEERIKKLEYRKKYYEKLDNDYHYTAYSIEVKILIEELRYILDSYEMSKKQCQN